jgi:hypothetical protein
MTVRPEPGTSPSGASAHAEIRTSSASQVARFCTRPATSSARDSRSSRIRRISSTDRRPIEHHAGLRTRLMSTGNPLDSAQFRNCGNSCTFWGMRQWLTETGRPLARATAA